MIHRAPHPSDIDLMRRTYHVDHAFAKNTLRRGYPHLTRYNGPGYQICTWLKSEGYGIDDWYYKRCGTYIFKDPELATMVKLVFG